MLLLCCADEHMRERWCQGVTNAAVVRRTDNYQHLKQHLADLNPDLVLLHLDLPGLERYDGIVELIGSNPDLRLFVLSNAPSDEEGLALLKAGVRGYANTYIDPELLKRAIDVVLSGEVWVGRRLMTRIIEESARRGRRRGDVESERVLELLTDREREIALLVGRGASNGQIATTLNITERTVKAHVSSIFEKIGVQDRLQLALLVNGHQS
ncbi:MAG: response regulator transcription factor [Gammaproteobacteria bacterium]|nr:response regulator transcription factor [Gammaproteobacteria bacterium]